MAFKDPITIYWSPAVAFDVPGSGEWNMLYKDPTTLFSELYQVKTKESKENSFFSCPAVSEKFKHTYVFTNQLTSEYQYKFNPEFGTPTDFGLFATPKSNPYLEIESIRYPSVSTGPLIRYPMSYVLFSEEPLIASFTPPMFHKPRYTNYGTVIPGSFDIGNWFRPYVCELQLWENQGTLKIEEGEPLFYVEFMTDRKILLKRFNYTNVIHQYVLACTTAPRYYGNHLPLVDRYKRFRETRQQDRILIEIKKNLID